jgi:hypothetical protein
VGFSGSALIYPAGSSEHPKQDGEGLQAISRLQSSDVGVDWNREEKKGLL